MSAAPKIPDTRSASSAILVFDGACSLCNGFVRFLVKRDSQRRLRFSAAQSDFGMAAMRAEGIDPDDPSSILLLNGQDALHMSDAILAAVRGLGGIWRAASAMRLVPRPLRDKVYRLVARNRYRWFGMAKACEADLQADSWRFLR